MCWMYTLQVTKNNTVLLNKVAELTNSKLTIARDLNAPAKVVHQPSKLEAFRENEEFNRIKAYVQFQAKELEALRTELNMLKRKEAPAVFSASLPNPPVQKSSTAQGETKPEPFLPPINPKH
jgi:hypothetical protein